MGLFRVMERRQPIEQEEQESLRDRHLQELGRDREAPGGIGLHHRVRQEARLPEGDATGPQDQREHVLVEEKGPSGHPGGGTFSGKDCTKVDRSGAYYARYVAKSIVKAGLADRCEVAVSYSIGVSNPISVSIDTFGTGKLSDDELLKLIEGHFDFSVGNIIRELRLKDITYQRLSEYGHFGNGVYPWRTRMERQRNSRRLQPKRLHSFYKSDAWHKARDEVILRAKGRCEVCGKPGTEVHHKIHLTLDNVDDPSIALNLDNLLLCKECHNKMHGRFGGRMPKYRLDED